MGHRDHIKKLRSARRFKLSLFYHKRATLDSFQAVVYNGTMSARAWKIVIILTIIIAIIVGFYYVNLHKNVSSKDKTTNNNQNLSTIKINNTLLKVELATTPMQQEQGLSGRKYLPPDQGMLFVFNNKCGVSHILRTYSKNNG